MRLIVLGILGLGLAGTASAQVSVPSVTTASPGGYANPLKLDTDRYKRNQGQPVRSQPRTAHGRCKGVPMTANQRAGLEAGFRTRRAQGGWSQGYNWLEAQCGATAAIQIQRTAERRR